MVYLNYLNGLLSLANLQNAFYQQNLANLDDNAFNSSGYGSDVRNNFAQISQNKQDQVNLLAQTLGACATPFCDYNFQTSNASNFATTSQVIESIGTSAYVGSIGQISNSTLSIWAASILSSNARAASYTSFVNGAQPVIGPFDASMLIIGDSQTPLTPQQATTLASSYVTSCPANSTNVYQPGQNLTITQASPTQAQFNFDNPGGQLYAVYHQGLSNTIVPLNNGTADIPTNTTGIVFAEVRNSTDVANDNNIVAGPSFLNIPVPNGSNGTIPASGPGTTIASSAAATSTSAASSAPATSSSEPVTTSTSTVASSSSEQSTVVVSTTSSTEQSTVVVTATSATDQSTVVVTATASA
ncbi:hypothetical protein DXG01_010918 [Tephrocybe rancida]|nr:hypothetical protein DXG01_010918 [Tephrocybe rancida]